MNNNTLLVLCVVGSVTLGVFIGYFAFLGVYQKQFAQQDRVALDNFESATVTLKGNIINVQDNIVVVASAGVNFPLQITKDTTISVPDTEGLNDVVIKTGRVPLKEGAMTDLSIGQTTSVIAFLVDSSFQAISITVFPTP